MKQNIISRLISSIKLLKFYYLEAQTEIVANAVIPSRFEFETVLAQDEDINQILKKGSGHYVLRLQEIWPKNKNVYVAKHKGDICGFTTIDRKKIQFSNGFIICQLKDEIYSYNSYVLPEYRGKKIFQKLKQDVCKLFLNQGQTKVVALVESKNIHSLKAQLRIGFKPKKAYWVLFISRYKFRVFQKNVSETCLDYLLQLGGVKNDKTNN